MLTLVLFFHIINLHYHHHATAVTTKEFKVLELWVNFDHKYCFWAKCLELILIFLMLVQSLSVSYC